MTQQYLPEANAFRISDMVKYLKKTNVDITILSPHPTIPIGSFKRKWKISETKKIDGVNVVNLWTWQPARGNPNFVSRIAYYLIFSAHTSVWAALHSKKYDVMITSTPPIFISLPGLVSKYLFNKPWIVDVRDLWIDAAIGLKFIKRGSLYERLARAFEKQCYLKCDKVIATTNTIIKKVSALYEIDIAKFNLIPNGVDIRLFYPSAVNKKPQIIYEGSLSHAYDLENMILAMKYIRDDQVKLLIVGDGDTKESLDRVVRENDLHDKVIFTGYMPRGEVPKLISESILGVAPLKKLESLEYSVPSKTYEYLGCGTPFMGCGTGEIQNMADESGAGIIVENDPEIIASRITSLLGDRVKLVEMGRNGREYVEQHFDRKKIANDLNYYINQIYIKNSVADGS